MRFIFPIFLIISAALGVLPVVTPAVADQGRAIFPSFPRQPVQPVEVDLNSLPLKDRLIARLNLLRPDLNKACSGLPDDYKLASQADRYTDQIAFRLMFTCGYDVSERLKVDILSEDRRTSRFALKLWRAHRESTAVKLANVTGLIIDHLVHAGPIKSWSRNDEPFSFYLAVDGIARDGRLSELNDRLAFRSDYRDFAMFMDWYEDQKHFYETVVKR